MTGKARPGKSVVQQAAIDSFTECGYHGTSMRGIAEAAGVSVAAIYHHYRSKQDILVAIMEQVLTDAISVTRGAALSASGSAAEQLSAIMREWVLFHTNRRAEAQIGASELRSLQEPGRRLVVALRDEQERLFRDVVVRGVGTGEFATSHPVDAARAIINMGYAIASWYRPDGEAGPEEMASRYAELALATVRGPNPAGA